MIDEVALTISPVCMWLEDGDDLTRLVAEKLARKTSNISLLLRRKERNPTHASRLEFEPQGKIITHGSKNSFSSVNQ